MSGAVQELETTRLRLVEEQAVVPGLDTFTIEAPAPYYPPPIVWGGATIISERGGGYGGGRNPSPFERSRLPDSVLDRVSQTISWIFARQWNPQLPQTPSAVFIPSEYHLYIYLPRDDELFNQNLAGSSFIRIHTGDTHILYSAKLNTAKTRAPTPNSMLYNSLAIRTQLEHARDKNRSPGGTAWLEDFKAPHGQMYRILPENYRNRYSVINPIDIDPETGKPKGYWFPNAVVRLFHLQGPGVYQLPRDNLELILHELTHVWRMTNMPWPDPPLDGRYVAFPDGKGLQEYLAFMDQFRHHPWVEEIHQRFLVDWQTFRYGFIGEAEAYITEMCGTRALVEEDKLASQWSLEVWERRSEKICKQILNLLNSADLSGIPEYKVYGVLVARAIHEAAETLSQAQQILGEYSQLIDYSLGFKDRLIA